jgi:hypothetical protein
MKKPQAGAGLEAILMQKKMQNEGGDPKFNAVGGSPKGTTHYFQEYIDRSKFLSMFLSSYSCGPTDLR